MRGRAVTVARVGMLVDHLDSHAASPRDAGDVPALVLRARIRRRGVAVEVGRERASREA